jgi:hypothetical protein
VEIFDLLIWARSVGGASISIFSSKIANACILPLGQKAFPVPRKSTRATHPDTGTMT